MVRLAPYNNLDIINILTPQDFNNFYAKYTVGYIDKSLPNKVLEPLFGQIPPSNTARCKCVIIENDYVDEDFLEAYSRFYSKCFDNISQKSSRFHFFSKNIQLSDIYDLERLDDGKTYLGYSVFRPIKTCKISRTVIKPSITDRDKEFFIARSSYQINLSGSKLSVEGIPFMEQDTNVAACASTALWISAICMNKLFGEAMLSTSLITELATKYDVSHGRSMPSPGLTSGQMLEALRSMGYGPIYYMRPSSNEAKVTVYRYIESGIPVMVLFSHSSGHHAITVVGHTYDHNIDPSPHHSINLRGAQINFLLNTEWIPEFYIHDDQRGPYRKLKFLDITNYILPNGHLDSNRFPMPRGCERKEDINCPVSVDGATGNIIGLVIPLPKEITLRAEHAQWVAEGLTCIAKGCFGMPDFDDVVIRTYLTRSNRYKERIKNVERMADSLKIIYRAKPMPKYIWVSEISKKDWMKKGGAEERLMCGEIIMDCTSSLMNESFIYVHVPGYLIKMNPDDSLGREAFSRPPTRIVNDQPYPHFSRVNVD